MIGPDAGMKFCSQRRLWGLWEMLSVKSGPFTRALATLASLEALLKINGGVNIDKAANFPVFGKITNTYLSALREFRIYVRDLELEVTSTYVDRLISTLEKYDTIQSHKLYEMLGFVIQMFPDEINKKIPLMLTRTEADLYEDRSPFGNSVASKFDSAVYEIEESTKCLALGRSTASAMHAIRCLEAGIRAISRCLGIPDPIKASDRSWFNMLNAIKVELDKRWPLSSNKLSGDGRFFEEAYAALAAMQNPYRNATMHLDHKYTEDEAKHIFEIVKGFMRKLAERCDENGNPKA
jgi:hypothetical protein